MTGIRRTPAAWRLVLSAVALMLMLLIPTQAQSPPSPPSMPRIVVPPLISYEEGIANIRAQDAARPPAIQPKLPGGAHWANPLAPAPTPVPAPGGNTEPSK